MRCVTAQKLEKLGLTSVLLEVTRSHLHQTKQNEQREALDYPTALAGPRIPYCKNKMGEERNQTTKTDKKRGIIPDMNNEEANDSGERENKNFKNCRKPTHTR